MEILPHRQKRGLLHGGLPKTFNPAIHFIVDISRELLELLFRQLCELFPKKKKEEGKVKKKKKKKSKKKKKEKESEKEKEINRAL
jgi:hypothetical protein